jgi:uncharacterized protein (TIGR03437 family)
VLLWGPGLENVTPGDIQVLGPVFSLNSVEVDPLVIVNNFPALKLNIDVPAAAQQKAVVAQGVAGSALGTVLIRQGALATAATGVFAVEGLAGGQPAPVFSHAGVVNAASFLGGGVAPGEIISIFGTDIGPQAQALPGFDPATGKLFTSFEGVTVTFDGTPAPLFFLIDNQLNLQAPFEIAGQANTNVVIRVNGQASPAVAVPVANQAPGIFTFAGGMGQGVIQNQDGSINTTENPEARGNAIVIFATGQGTVNPALETGQAAGQPLSQAANFAATIGGLDARAFFAGMTPGFVGLLQVNAFVPEGVEPGSEVPVQITINGAPSQPNVTMAVEP